MKERLDTVKEDSWRRHPWHGCLHLIMNWNYFFFKLNSNSMFMWVSTRGLSKDGGSKQIDWPDSTSPSLLAWRWQGVSRSVCPGRWGVKKCFPPANCPLKLNSCPGLEVKLGSLGCHSICFKSLLTRSWCCICMWSYEVRRHVANHQPRAVVAAVGSGMGREYGRWEGDQRQRHGRTASSSGGCCIC